MKPTRMTGFAIALAGMLGASTAAAQPAQSNHKQNNKNQPQAVRPIQTQMQQQEEQPETQPEEKAKQECEKQAEAQTSEQAQEQAERACERAMARQRARARARAQQQQNQVVVVEKKPAEAQQQPGVTAWSHWGMGVLVGGGIMGFTDSGLTDVTQTGGTWEARLAFGTRTPIGVEAAYVGSAQNLQALGLDSSAVLFSTGIEGDLRINMVQSFALQPYVLGGAGWQHFKITKSNFNNSDLNNSDNIVEIPVGAGLAYRFNHIMLDLRGTYRIALNSGLVQPQANGERPPNTALNTWSATFRLGYEF